ncbi:MAG: ester cyclase [Pseudomonadota bacterium]
MSLEANKTLARRSIEMWAGDNNDKPEEVFSADYANHQESDVRGGVRTRDLQSWKDVVAQHHVGFPDLAVTVDMQVAEGDKVATRWEFSGTHQGTIMGVEATGNRVTWTGVQIDRIENGKIVESWVDWDKYRLFEGLGLVK